MISPADSRIMGRLPIGGGSEVVAPVFLPSLRDGVAGVAGGICNASLTKRQMDAMRFIQGHIDAKIRAPSYLEIMAATGIKSKGHVAQLVNCLIERGFLARNRKARHNVIVLRRVSVPSIDGCPLFSVSFHGEQL